MTLFAESFARVASSGMESSPEQRAESFCVLCVRASSDWPACAKSSEKICFLSALCSLILSRSRPTTATFSRGSLHRVVCESSGCCRAADSHIKAPAALIETQMPIKRRIMAAQCQKGGVNCTLFCFATSVFASLYCIAKKEGRWHNMR